MMMDESNASFIRQPSEEENNMVVAVRVRPLSPREEAAGCQACCKVINQKIVVISKAGNPAHYLRSQQGTVNEYAFDAAFGDGSTQAEVYENTAKRHVPAVLDGCNVTVFAYGATGAGKTHTMMGSERTGEAVDQQEHHTLSGIIPQSLVDVFACVERRRQQGAGREEKWKLYASFLEVYNEQIYDLVAGGRLPLAVREDSQRGVVQVAGLSEIEVSSTSEVLDLLRQGNRNRKTESTAANQVSSRSHAVLQVILRYACVDAEGNDVVRESKLSLIDLAGSERASATQNRGVRLQEGANINKSLLALANCINALAENGSGKLRKNVKYRDSKLTHLLKTSLEGDCKLIMIANINPSHHVFEDSHNTLKYANRAKNIKIKPGTAHLLTQEVPWPVREARLRADNEKLRDELDYLRQCLLTTNSKAAGTAHGKQPANTILPSSSQPEQPEVSSLMEDANQSLSTSGAGSFLSTCESMEIDDQTASNDDSLLLHQGSSHAAEACRRRSTRRMSQLIPLNSPPVMVSGGPAVARAGGGRDMEDVMQEMARTREFMQGLIESLNTQKAHTEAQLQAQRAETQSWQRQAQEKDQEIARLREQLVELRTRLEQQSGWAHHPAAASSASSSSAAALDHLPFSPINPAPPSAIKDVSSSHHPLGSPAAASKRATSRRRMSQIPRFTQHQGSSRRATLMPASKMMVDEKDDDDCSVASGSHHHHHKGGLSVHNEQQQASAIMGSGKKRPRGGTATTTAWGPIGGALATTTSTEEEKENKAPRVTRRQSSVMMLRGPGAASAGKTDGVAQRTRSRQSMLMTAPEGRFCF